MIVEQKEFLVNAYGEKWTRQDLIDNGYNSDCAGLEHTCFRRLAMETLIPYTKGVGVDIGSQLCPVTNTAIRCDGDPRFQHTQNILNFYPLSNLDYITASHVIEDQIDPVNFLIHCLDRIKVGGYICLLIPHCDRYPKPGEPGANVAHRFATYPSTFKEWEEQLKSRLKIVSFDKCEAIREKYKDSIDCDCVYQKI